MPEGNPDKSPDYNKRFQEIIDAPQGVQFVSRFADFDARSEVLHGSLAMLATNLHKVISGEQQPTIDLDNIAEQVGGMVRAMLEIGDDTDEITETMVQVMATSGRKRAELMNQLLSDPEPAVVVAAKQEDLRKTIEGCIKQAESNEHAIENITQVYHAKLAEDVDKFIQDLIKSHKHSEASESEIDMQTIEIKKDMKDHVTDVAKIALGVSIAFAVNKLINRNT